MAGKNFSIDQLRFGFGYNVRDLTEHSKRIAFLFAFLKSTKKQFRVVLRKWQEHNRYLSKKERGPLPKIKESVDKGRRLNIGATPPPTLNKEFHYGA